MLFITLIENLLAELAEVERLMIELINHSKIIKSEQDFGSNVIAIFPDYYWAKGDEEQKRLQIQLMKKYQPLFEKINLLFSNAPPIVKADIKNTNVFVLDFINQASSWNVKPTKGENIKLFCERIGLYKRFLKMMAESKKEIIIIPDANALIDHPDFENYNTYLGIDKCTIFFTPTVLSELDELKLKLNDKDKRQLVRRIIKQISETLDKGNPEEGIPVNDKICVKFIAVEPSFTNTLSWLDKNNNDDRILATILEIQVNCPNIDVLLVTSDINLKNKAKYANIPVKTIDI